MWNLAWLRFGKATSSCIRTRFRSPRWRTSLARRPVLERLEDRLLLSAGDLDLSFGTGTAQTVFNSGSGVSAMAAYPSSDVADAGKIVVVGSGDFASGGAPWTVAQYTRNGILDSTYGTNGLVTDSTDRTGVNEGAVVVAIQPQANGPSMIIVGGYWPDANNASIDHSVLARYSSTGVPDQYFNGGVSANTSGRIFSDFGEIGGLGGASGLAIEPNGDIVVSWETPAGNHVVARYLALDGSLDTNNFGTMGATSLGTFHGGINPVAIQQIDGKIKIVVAGVDAVPEPTGVNGFALTRLNADGSRDTGFGTNGTGEVLTSFVPNDSLVHAGFFGTAFSATLFALAIQGDGNIVAVGSEDLSEVNGSFPPWLIARYNKVDGSLDGTFGHGGIITSNFDSFSFVDNPNVVYPNAWFPLSIDPPGAAWSNATTVVAQGDKLVIGDASGHLVRLNQSDGTLDATFGTGGAVTSANSIGFAALQGEEIVTVGGGRPSTLQRFFGTDVFTPTGLQDALDGLPTGGTLTVQTTTPQQAHNVIAAANGLDPAMTPAATLVVDLGGQTIQDTVVNVPSQVTVQFVNGTFIGGSPALIVGSGDVIVLNSTFTNTTDAPTILVTGGHLTLRNDIIQESTGYNQAAIKITGGTVDLGTATDLGGNTLNIDGAGKFVDNTTASPIAAVGDTFLVNGVPLAPDSLSGFVWEDFNDDGQIDFGEKGISGVAVTLTGTDFLGNAVNQPATTDSDGAYIFANLRPGSYYITKTQPAGYLRGIDSIGTAGGSLSATDQFFVQLAQDDSGRNGLNYNFGERPASSGPVQHGQTAGIGFWNNKNGQALIKVLNGGGTGTELGDWLAATLPNTFGIHAGSNNLTGKSNAYVAALFQQDFLVHGVKLDAQVLATALSVYATNATLDSTGVAAQYGFTITTYGVGTDTVNVGKNGAAFGVADNTVMTILDLLLATDAQAVNGVLYGGNATKRNEANTVFSAVNQAGHIN